MSYWNEQPNVKQVMSEKVSYPTNEGLSFRSDNNRKIQIHIPPSCEFIQPSDTFLKFKLKVDFNITHATLGAIKQRLQLVPELGASVLIKNLVINAGSGKTLESVEDANCLSSIKLMYNKNMNLDNKRSNTEGVVLYDFRTRSFGSTTDVVRKMPTYNTYTNPYFNTLDNQEVELCVPFHCSGLLGETNEKILPVALLNGLDIFLELEEPRYCFRAIQSAVDIGTKTAYYAPHLDYGEGGVAGDGLVNTDAYNFIFIKQKNSNTETFYCPFVIGELIGLKGGETLGKISDIEKVATGLKISLSAPYTANADYDADTPVISVGLTDVDCTSTLEYEVRDVEIQVKKCFLDPATKKAMENSLSNRGTITYPFLAYENYRRMINNNELSPTIDLPLSNRLGLSILHQPCEDNSNLTQCLTNFLIDNNSYFKLTGKINDDKSYAVFLGGRQNPDRDVPLDQTATTTGHNQRHLQQLRQALNQASIPVINNLYSKNNFVIGKPLGIEKGVMDLASIENEYQIRLNYNSTSTNNKSLNSFVSHIRQIQITSNGINCIH